MWTQRLSLYCNAAIKTRKRQLMPYYNILNLRRYNNIIFPSLWDPVWYWKMQMNTLTFLTVRPHDMQRALLMPCPECVCIAQYECKRVRSVCPIAWPRRGACSEFRASGPGPVAVSGLMTGLNAQWHRQLVPTGPLAPDRRVHCVPVCAHSWCVFNTQQLLSSHQYPLSHRHTCAGI